MRAKVAYQSSKHRMYYGLLFLVALALRLFAIEQQSLWADEGGTLALASHSLAQIMHDTLIDVHPPLYYWLLHGWMLLFGQSVLTVRSLSALCGALATPLTAILARRWFGTSTGIVAGMAAALSPFSIYYSQETRMYALALLLSCMLWLALEHWLAQPNAAGFGCYFACAAALLATHYFMVTLIIAANVALLSVVCITTSPARGGVQAGEVRQRILIRSTHLIIWIVGHAVLAIFYLGLVWASRTRLTTWTDTKQALSPAFILSDALRHFSLGPNVDLNTSTWLWSGFFLALVLIGVCARGAWRGRVYAVIWLLVPLILMIVLSLGQPYYKSRFLLPALPAFQLLCAHGLVMSIKTVVKRAINTKPLYPTRSPHHPITRSYVPLLALSLLLAAAWQPLNTMWFDPRFWRDDYRGAAQRIADTAGPDDALILNGQSQIDTLNVYEHSALPRFLLPHVRPLDATTTTAELAQIAATHRRLYALFYVLEESDPQGVMANWLDTHAYRASSQWFGALHMIVWETNQIRATPQVLNIQFSNGPTLQAAQLSASSLHPGDGLRVQLQWQGSINTAHNVFLHLVSADGSLLAQYDGPLTEMTRAALLVPPESMVGSYTLVLGLYDPVSGMRLRLADGSGELVLLSKEEILSR